VTCQNPPTHMAVHLAICYSKSRFTSMMVIGLTCSVVNGIEYGRADGESEDQAKNAAARVALIQLRQEVQGSNSSTSPPWKVVWSTPIAVHISFSVAMIYFFIKILYSLSRARGNITVVSTYSIVGRILIRSLICIIYLIIPLWTSKFPHTPSLTRANFGSLILSLTHYPLA